MGWSAAIVLKTAESHYWAHKWKSRTHPHTLWRKTCGRWLGFRTSRLWHRCRTQESREAADGGHRPPVEVSNGVAEQTSLFESEITAHPENGLRLLLGKARWDRRIGVFSGLLAHAYLHTGPNHRSSRLVKQVRSLDGRASLSSIPSLCSEINKFNTWRDIS